MQLDDYAIQTCSLGREGSKIQAYDLVYWYNTEFFLPPTTILKRIKEYLGT